jgi:hypothetical protein
VGGIGVGACVGGGGGVAGAHPLNINASKTNQINGLVRRFMILFSLRKNRLIDFD